MTMMNRLMYSVLTLTLLGTAWAADCKNGGRLIDGECKCLPGLRGEDCNTLIDFCTPIDEYNYKCATDACITMFGGFYCTRCKNESLKGMFCNREKTDTTKLMSGPYLAFPPQMTFMETTEVLFSMETLGDGFALEIRWGDGTKDFASPDQFLRGRLQDIIPTLKIDALAPGTAGYNSLPKGMRYYVKLEHVFNSGGADKTIFFIANNFPRGLSVDIKQQESVYVGPAPFNTPNVTIHGCGAGGDIPTWTRLIGMEVYGEVQWMGEEPSDAEFKFVLITHYRKQEQRRHPPRAAPDKRYSIPAFSLPFGLHCLEFSVWRKGKMLQFTTGFVEVVGLPIAAVVVGGHKREVGPGSLVLDASPSNDLNELNNSLVDFEWSCNTTVADSFCEGFRPSGIKVVIAAGKLKINTVYIFTLTASRLGLYPPSEAKQTVLVRTGLSGQLSIVCDRNCGRGGVVVASEPVFLRPRCEGECSAMASNSLTWKVQPPLADGDMVQDRSGLMIKGGAMTTKTFYDVTLSGENLGRSMLTIKTQGKLLAFCDIKYNETVTVLCKAAWEGMIYTTDLLLFQVFQVIESEEMDSFLLDFSYSGEINITHLATPYPALLRVRVSHVTGAYVWLELENKIPPAPSMSVTESLEKAGELFEIGEDRDARVALLAGLTSSTSVDSGSLRDVIKLLHKHTPNHVILSDWIQEMSIVGKVVNISQNMDDVMPSELAEVVLPMAESSSLHLVTLARQRDPVGYVPSKYVLGTFSQMLLKVSSMMVLDPGSPEAEAVRNISVPGSELDEEYPVYADLVPGYLQRVRQYRVAGRAALSTMRNIVHAVLWRILPSSAVTVISRPRVSFFMKVGTLQMLAEESLTLRVANSSARPPSLSLDMQAAGPLLKRSDNWAMTLGRMEGNVYWAEEQPPHSEVNSDSSLMVLLHEYKDGQGVPAPAVPGLLSVTIPAMSEEKAYRTAATNVVTLPKDKSELKDSIVVHSILVERKHRFLQVNFLPQSGANFPLRAVLQKKWPKVEDLTSERSVLLDSNIGTVLSLRIAEESNTFMYLGIGPDSQSLEWATSHGLGGLSQTYSFTANKMACKHFFEKEFKWKTNIDQEVGVASNATGLTCKLAHLSVVAGLVLVAPNFVHPWKDAHLFLEVADNWIVLAYVVTSIFVWLVWLYFARRQDLRTDDEWQVVVLEEVPEDASHAYLITVFSGQLGRPQTTAHICMHLIGDLGESGPHPLARKGRLLCSSCDDWFILYTLSPLGELKSLELWTNCAGSRPYWYCEKVRVEELSSGRTWMFPAFCWLSPEHGNRMASVVLYPGQLTVLQKTFILFKAIFRYEHLWASAVLRHPRMNFTRAQRLTVAFAQHFLDMITNLMFLGAGERPDELEEGTMTELLMRSTVIAMECSLITMIPGGLIVYLFEVEEMEAIRVIEKGSNIESEEVKEAEDVHPKEPEISQKTGCGENEISPKTKTSGVQIENEAILGEKSGTSKENEDIVTNVLMQNPSSTKETTSDIESGSQPILPSKQVSAERKRVAFNFDGEDESVGLGTGTTAQAHHGYRSVSIKAHSQDVVISLGGSSAPSGPSGAALTHSARKVGSTGKDEGNHPEALEKTYALNGAGKVYTGAQTVSEFPDPSGPPESSSEGQEAVDDKARESGGFDKASQVSAGGKVDNVGGQPDRGKPSYDEKISNLRKRGPTSPPLIYNPPERERIKWRLRRRDTWRIRCGWVVCSMIMVTCGYFIILYGLKYGWFISAEWLSAMCISLVTEIFFIHPAKIFATAFVLTKWFQQESPLECKKVECHRPVILPEWHPPQQPGYRIGHRSYLYSKLTREDAMRIRLLRLHRTKIIRCIWDSVFWLLWIIFLYGCIALSTESIFFHLQHHVRELLVDVAYTRTRRFGFFYDVFTYSELYEYLNESLVGSLERRKISFDEQDAVETPTPFVAFSADNVTRLLSVVRLRHLRITDTSTKPFIEPKPMCYGEYQGCCNDRKSYGEGWTPLDGPAVLTGDRAADIWIYRNSSQTGAVVSMGFDSILGSDGYVCDLGRVEANARLAVSYLKETKWMDLRTRALIAELVLYSPAMNIFCEVQLIVERTAASSFAFKAQMNTFRLSGSMDRWTGEELLLVLPLVAVSVVLFAREVASLLRLGLRYSWNVFDVILCLFLACTTVTYILITRHVDDVLRELKTADPSAYQTFALTSSLDNFVTVGLGVVMLLAAVRCWKVLSTFSSHFASVKNMLVNAYKPLLVMLCHLLVVQLQFAMLFMLFLGDNVHFLHTVHGSLMLLMVSIVDYTKDYRVFARVGWDSPLVQAFYWTFVSFMFFFYLNFFLGIVWVAFENASEEVRSKVIGIYSVKHLIWDELMSLLGLPCDRQHHESSILRHALSSPVIRKLRVRAKSREVSLDQLKAMGILLKCSVRERVIVRDMEFAMGAVVRGVQNAQEAVHPETEITFLRSYTPMGPELFHAGKVDNVMYTINNRAEKQAITSSLPDSSELCYRLLRLRSPVPQPPLTCRYRPPRPGHRATGHRVAVLSVRRDREWHLRLRLFRETTPDSDTEKQD